MTFNFRWFILAFMIYSVPEAMHLAGAVPPAESDAHAVDFFETKIRPLLVEHCYACHSEESGEQKGGLLLDRRSGWIVGGDTQKAVLPGEPDASLLIKALRYDGDLKMPPDGRLSDQNIALFEYWTKQGAVGPLNERGETAFSLLGNQPHLFSVAANHWSFQPVEKFKPPQLTTSTPIFSNWNKNPIDQFIGNVLLANELHPSRRAVPKVLARRLHYDLTGLPPSYAQLTAFNKLASKDFKDAVTRLIDRLIDSPQFGEHVGRMWLDVVRYGDTDNDYRADTRTPHYYPFAFSYRDYVIESFNSDKSFAVFLKEQLAADLMPYPPNASQLAALGFYATGPFANRSPSEALDDWIDLTTRGLLGISAACARCHDHKFEPVPTADYYSLRGVFAAVKRVQPLDEKKQPVLASYRPSDNEIAEYEAKRATIDAKIKASEGKKNKSNNRSASTKIRETELAKLLTFHPGAPARAMCVTDLPNPPPTYVFLRGEPSARGEQVPRRFLKILDPQQTPFPEGTSGRLQLAEHIASAQNPLTARVYVNRVWGHLIGSHLVETPSDFGLQGSKPTHPKLLDWLVTDFIAHGWSTKHLVRRIVTSQVYQQSSTAREHPATHDPLNQLLWRAHRKHLRIEAIRDSMLSASGELNLQVGGHSSELWGKKYTKRRTVYGFINRFNLDPTLRAFDFPASVQTSTSRGESIVPQQALFTLNSPFVIDQATALTTGKRFQAIETNKDRITYLFRRILGRQPAPSEREQAMNFAHKQLQKVSAVRSMNSPWPLIAQAMLMSNEFQYVD
ncbi:PSD1 and planctomycete cytochrome C domain-containing protein [bacterium]|nr:PSD1 and planctomycete cytochrome C domain-containing protein [bacterium]